jgi:hypothetical protein
MKPYPQSSKTATLSESCHPQHGRISGRCSASSLMLLAVFLALTSTALASSTWYVDGVNGSNNNNCKTPQTACKTIKHAISLASSGNSIIAAAATYKENLTFRFSLRLVGSGAATTITDGGGVNTVITISSASAHVSLSKLTIQNGFARGPGGGIYNGGALRINNTTIRGNTAFGTGGGIYNSGTLTVIDSTLSGNRVTPSGGELAGVGISNNGTLTISNSTISGNSAYTKCFTPCEPEVAASPTTLR